jgi:hypothetical protein
MMKSSNQKVILLRVLAGAAALFCLAAFALFIGHHHPDESDTSTCLVCQAVSAPAVQPVSAPLSAVARIAAHLPFYREDHRTVPGWPGYRTARAPPSC